MIKSLITILLVFSCAERPKTPATAPELLVKKQVREDVTEFQEKLQTINLVCDSSNKDCSNEVYLVGVKKKGLADFDLCSGLRIDVNKFVLPANCIEAISDEDNCSEYIFLKGKVQAQGICKKILNYQFKFDDKNFPATWGNDFALIEVDFSSSIKSNQPQILGEQSQKVILEGIRVQGGQYLISKSDCSLNLQNYFQPFGVSFDSSSVSITDCSQYFAESFLPGASVRFEDSSLYGILNAFPRIRRTSLVQEGQSLGGLVQNLKCFDFGELKTSSCNLYGEFKLEQLERLRNEKVFFDKSNADWVNLNTQISNEYLINDDIILWKAESDIELKGYSFYPIPKCIKKIEGWIGQFRKGNRDRIFKSHTYALDFGHKFLRLFVSSRGFIYFKEEVRNPYRYQVTLSPRSIFKEGQAVVEFESNGRINLIFLKICQ
jgi:hypothetical protein